MVKSNRLLRFSLLVGAVFVCLGFTPAAAAVVDGSPVKSALLQLDTTLVLLGLATPFLTALLAKARIPDWQSGLISVAVTAAVVLLKQGLVDNTLTWATFINGWIQILGAHMGSYFLGTSDPVARLNAQTGTIGLGTPRTDSTQPEQVKPTPPPA